MKKLNKKIILLTSFIFILPSLALAADVSKYFVLIGNTGAGKSTIYEKMTGMTGLSGGSSEFTTTNSRVGSVDDIMFADTPGVKASKDRLEHALQILGALRFRPLTALVFVIEMSKKDSLTIENISNLIAPFYEYEDLISIIVTHHDQHPKVDKTVLKKSIEEELEISHVYISSCSSTKNDYVSFFNGINTKPLDISIEPVELTRYFNLESLKHKKKMGIFNKYLLNYRELCANGTKYVLGLNDAQERMDMTFSFNALMTDTISDIQREFAEKAKLNLLDNNDLVWTMQLAHAMKQELFEIRKAVDIYQKNSPKNFQTYRKCPYCGNVYVLVEACDGTTTCGNMPSNGDKRPKISVFKWDWRNLLNNGLRFDNFERKDEEVAKAQKTNLKYNPELTKPCGNKIAFRDMAPVTDLPMEWEKSSNVNDVLDTDEGDLARFKGEVDNKFKMVKVIKD